MPVRRENYYSGHVQGVGFRYTARNIASRFEVAGFFRNLPDGRVHLVVEGEIGEVNAFLKDLAVAMQDAIHRVTTDDTPPTGEFREFSIRF